MPRNIEAKYRCADLEAVRARAEALGARRAATLHQTDAFFAAPQARLKLRMVEGAPAELIAYRRADVATPRPSDYLIAPIAAAEAEPLLAALAEALGPPRIVRKRRTLYLHHHSRIHLDEVASLGTFVELETVITTQTAPEATTELTHLATALALPPEDLVPVPYVDLLPRQR